MKQIKGFISGVVLTTLLFAGTMTVFAATQSIQVSFDNIKIAVDGKVITPKDVSGNTVQPFIYNGTTYLPIRAIGEAIGKEVSWDQATKTASLGGAPSTDTMKYYVDFPTVPDFGAVSGAVLAKSQFEEEGKSYTYNYSYPSGSVEKYVKVLEAQGFVYRGDLVSETSLAYEKNGVYVTMEPDESGFVVYILMF